MGKRSDLQGTGSSNSGEIGRGLGEQDWVEQVTQAEELLPPSLEIGWYAPQFPRDNESPLVAGRDGLAWVTPCTL